MLWSIAAFEIRKRLRQMSTYVYFGLFFGIGLLVMLAAGGAFQSVSVLFGSGGKTMVNSPFVLCSLISVLSYFGLLVTAAVMGQAIYQDFHHGTHALFFTAPISKFQYVGGRFIGSIIVLIGIFSSIALGCWIGTLMPFLDRNLFGPNRLAAYVAPYGVSVLPNLLIAGSMFFALAALTRKILPVYVTSVILLIGYMIAASLTVKIERKLLAAIIDPFGMNAIDHVTEYWTVAERNTRLVPLSGALLWNRLLWLGVAGAVSGFTLWRFRLTEVGEERRSRVRDDASHAPAVVMPTAGQREFRPLRLLPRMTWLAFRETAKNIYFVVIVLAGVLFMIFAAQSTGSLFGTETYPVTAEVLEIAGGSFTMFMIIILTFYSGELVWRERDANAHQLCDVLPIPTWLPFAAKLAALILVQFVLLAVVMLCGIGIQLFQGYTKIELGQYFQTLFGIRLIEFALLCVLAMTVHVLVNNKYLGHFVMVLYFLASAFMSRFGFEHKLYDYAGNPGFTYSDMNGFGPFVAGLMWFDAYWATCAVLLSIVVNLFWVRGLEESGRQRLALARSRLTRAAVGAFVVFAVCFAGLGAFIFYNTNVLAEYKTSYERECEQADYEKQYKKHENEAQPRVTDVRIAIDLFPETRAARATGSFTLQNKTTEPIGSIFVQMPTEIKIHRLGIGDQPKPTHSDTRLGFHTFELPNQMQPGQELPLEFDVEYHPQGIDVNDSRTAVVANGTFFNSDYLPHVGYQENYELSDDDTRRKHGLEAKPRMPDINDAAALRNNYISSDADWISLDAVVSTNPDQIAIVPGYLVREWTDSGRRFFHYKTEGQILHFFSVLSARYEVRRDRWVGPVVFGKSDSSRHAPRDANITPSVMPTDQEVAIEIYYHCGHEYNIDKMIESIKDSLDYFTANFSPYQHRQVRIIEFPRYATFAQSFPNTIPYSEGIGFIARVDPSDPDDLDYPYYVTAHEVAHQWWAHQVIGGNVQGATMLSETMAQYSALMVMKHKYGDSQMRKFLRYELNQYLIGRGLERKKELPLARNENQGYIHYNKGSLVMYALQDYLGEEAVNRALADFILVVGYQEPPYTTSLELIEQLRQVTPIELQYLIEDLFETITLFDNRAVSASYAEAGPGEYEVQLKVSARKYRSDELGAEQDRPLDDLIDIGVLDADGKVMQLEKHRIKANQAEFTIRVAKPPAKAGIDPLNKLIDRKPDDNVVRVEKK